MVFLDGSSSLHMHPSSIWVTYISPFTIISGSIMYPTMQLFRRTEVLCYRAKDDCCRGIKLSFSPPIRSSAESLMITSKVEEGQLQDGRRSAEVKKKHKIPYLKFKWIFQISVSHHGAEVTTMSGHDMGQTQWVTKTLQHRKYIQILYNFNVEMTDGAVTFQPSSPHISTGGDMYETRKEFQWYQRNIAPAFQSDCNFPHFTV